MDVEKMIKRIQMVSLSCDLKTDEGVRHFHCGHEYVEIGGLKWAAMNVGAEKPTDYGLYFQWGDVQGYTADQVGSEKYFGWDGYKWANKGGSTFAKYNSTDGKTVLDSIDDAASFHWGGSWRIPTIIELQALSDAVNTKWTTNYNGSGVNGLLCTDKNDNSKTLFFPAAGFAYNGCMGGVRSSGFIGSSSLNIDYYEWNDARYVGFDNSITNWNFHSFRSVGSSVRGVVG